MKHYASNKATTISKNDKEKGEYRMALMTYWIHQCTQSGTLWKLAIWDKTHDFKSEEIIILKRTCNTTNFII